MAQFVVPQFIEREPKIVGPFSWRQFIYIGLAGVICFILYFSLPFHYFLLVAILLMTGALAMAFLRIGGRSVPVVLKNSLFFFLSPKIYLWGRKGIVPKIIKKEKIKPKEIKETSVLKIAEKSQLRKLTTQVETLSK